MAQHRQKDRATALENERVQKGHVTEAFSPPLNTAMRPSDDPELPYGVQRHNLV